MSSLTPAGIGSALSGYGQNLLPMIMRWVGIAVISAIILGAFYMLFMLFQYNILIYRLVLGENESKDGKKKYYIKVIKTMRAMKTT